VAIVLIAAVAIALLVVMALSAFWDDNDGGGV
jgi:hypothetical protein